MGRKLTVWSLTIIGSITVLVTAWMYVIHPYLTRRLVGNVVREIDQTRYEVEYLSELAGTIHIRNRDRVQKSCLVFVHGYSGNALVTWGYIIPGLTQDLPNKLDWLEQFDMLTVTYRTGLGKFQSIENVALQLKSAMDAHVLNRYDSVFILAHSMGGLVVQRYLLNELNSVDDLVRHQLVQKIRGIVYLDTPHDGLRIAEKGRFKWLLTLEKEALEMKSDSDFRKRLNQDWAAAFNQYGPAMEQLFIRRSWLLVAEETFGGMEGIGGLRATSDFKFKHFVSPRDGAGYASHREVPGTNHLSISKSTKEDFLAGKGVFHDYIAPLLGRHEVLTEVGKRPFGMSGSDDGKWIYVVSSHVKYGGYVKRISTASNQVDANWVAKVGTNPHEFAEVTLEEGRIGVSTDNDNATPDTSCPVSEEIQSLSCLAGLTIVDLITGKPLDRVPLDGNPDSIAVHSSLLAISDGGRNGRVWVVDAHSREITARKTVAHNGRQDWNFTGLAFIESGRYLLAVGHRGLEALTGILAIFQVSPDGKLTLTHAVDTLPYASDVAYLSGQRLAVVSSAKAEGAVAFHRVDGRRLTESGAEGVPPPLYFRGAPAVDLHISTVDGGEVILVACRDGNARRISWDADRREFNVFEYYHAGLESWGIVTDTNGNYVYVSNGDDTVSVIWLGDFVWPRSGVISSNH